MRRHGRVQRWAGKGNAACPKELLGGAAARRKVGTKPSPEHIDTITSYACSSPTIGGDAARRCQVNPKIQGNSRSEEHTSELQSLRHLVCRLLLEKKKTQ